AVSVKGVCGKAEANGARVALFGRGEVLRQAGKLAQKEGQNTSGHGVERAEVAYGALAGDSAQDSHHIVAGHACRFVYNEKSVHLSTLADGAGASHSACARVADQRQELKTRFLLPET